MGVPVDQHVPWHFGLVSSLYLDSHDSLWILPLIKAFISSRLKMRKLFSLRTWKCHQSCAQAVALLWSQVLSNSSIFTPIYLAIDPWIRLICTEKSADEHKPCQRSLPWREDFARRQNAPSHWRLKPCLSWDHPGASPSIWPRMVLAEDHVLLHFGPELSLSSPC